MSFVFHIREPGKKARLVTLQGHGGEFGAGAFYLGDETCRRLTGRLLRNARLWASRNDLMERIPAVQPGRSFAIAKLPNGTEVLACDFRGKEPKA